MPGAGGAAEEGEPRDDEENAELAEPAGAARPADLAEPAGAAEPAGRAQAEGAVDAEPGPEPPGDVARLAAAVLSLEELDELPVSDHVGRYEVVHGELSEALSSIDGV